MCQFLQEHLKKSFPVKKFGTLSYYLGYECRRDYERETLRVSGTAFIDVLAQTFAVALTTSSPASPTIVLSLREDKEEPCKQLYPGEMDGVMWIASATRPGMQTPFARLLDVPRSRACDSEKRVLRSSSIYRELVSWV